MRKSYFRYQHRRDLAAALTALDEVLREGEMCVETDTGLFKIGDGSTSWTGLPYSVNLGDANLILPDQTGNNGKYLTTDGSAVSWATVSGSGTVTHTGGALTSNALVLGAGADDTKVATGLTTDGASKLNLGVAGASVGSIAFANATSGSITLQPAAGALGTVTLTMPATTGALVTGGGSCSGACSGTNTGDQTITLTGAVTGSGTGLIATTAADGMTTVVNTGDQTSTANGATTDSTDLQISVTAGHTYFIEGRLILDGASAANDNAFRLAVAAGTMSGYGQAAAPGTSLTGQSVAITASAAANTSTTNVGANGTAGVPTAVAFWYSFTCTNTTTLKLQFGNAASGGANTILKKRSFIKYMDLA